MTSPDFSWVGTLKMATGATLFSLFLAFLYNARFSFFLGRAARFLGHFLCAAFCAHAEYVQSRKDARREFVKAARNYFNMLEERNNLQQIRTVTVAVEEEVTK